jgi:hypothetical protein
MHDITCRLSTLPQSCAAGLSCPRNIDIRAYFCWNSLLETIHGFVAGANPAPEMLAIPLRTKNALAKCGLGLFDKALNSSCLLLSTVVVPASLLSVRVMLSDGVKATETTCWIVVMKPSADGNAVGGR